MVSSIYIFAKVLLTNILLKVENNEQQSNVEQRVNDVIASNFKVIASILYYLFM